MKRILFITMFVVLTQNYFAVPPHPLYKDFSPAVQKQISKTFYQNYETRNLPENVLVLRVDFPDKQFDLTVDEPDSLAHNREYFERFMFHLKSYWEDASHENYTFSSYVAENVYTVSHEMGYYGDDEFSNERMPEFASEVVQLATVDIDFSQYDATVIFHAGAGQETDLDHIRTDEIWSTFITRSDLQEIFDLENDDYQGIETDGTFVSAFAILPETTWQDYFPEGDVSYKFGLLGLLAHEFGHHLGLPTLFDNVSSNGRSQGIGDFGIMGTGTWAGNGYVPPLPCAWSRTHLGWESPIEITHNSENLTIDYPLGNGLDVVYKIKISEKEYFLLENRQQNPDGSMTAEQGSFTFALLDSTEQDVYPEEHSLSGEPKFNFMENSYKGCEWDFFLPNYDYSNGETVDGSGLLIWHIDENVIEEFFTSNLDLNVINNDANHKGVDLEEADGLQHLDIGVLQPYFRGSPYDAYREGNNVYFGDMINPETDALSLPTSESYYGGSQMEIYNISSSETTMVFSVNFNWSLNTDYSGENQYPAAIIDFNNDDEMDEIVYPMPNGDIYIWEEKPDSVQTTVYQMNHNITENFAYNSNSQKLFFPSKLSDSYSAIYALQDTLLDYTILEESFHFSSHPIVISDEDILVLPLENENVSRLSFRDDSQNEILSYSSDSLKISSNIVWDEENLYFISANPDSINYLTTLSYPDLEETIIEFQNQYSLVNSSLYLVNFSSINRNFDEPIFVIKTDNSINLLTQNLQEIDGFPVEFPSQELSEPTFADVDNNGKLDIIVGGENRFYVISYRGTIINSPVSDIEYPDSLGIASGVIFHNNMLIGNMSRNRFYAWDEYFETIDGFPQSSNTRSRNFPLLRFLDGEFYSYLPSDNGTIYRHKIPYIAGCDEGIQSDLHYQTEYMNLQRTAFFAGINLTNQYETGDIFVKENVYIYPNPHNGVFGNGYINFNIMVSQDAVVKVQVYDVAGNLIYSEINECYEYLNNRGVFRIDISALSSGVYFAIFRSNNEIIKQKFAIEK
ncbi:MAG: M6 family metalloprotease domain-containing protein [Candidatus Cloacimonadota bacterium]|nr:M6 family metalloprotease domain-containing protein [Candidatus Cloacimonadota bacterium]